MTPSTDRVKVYDLEERTFEFARDVRAFIKRLPRTLCNVEDIKQLVRSSGSVGANYIEANEALSKKDFAMRARFAARKPKRAATGCGSWTPAQARRWKKSGRN